MIIRALVDRLGEKNDKINFRGFCQYQQNRTCRHIEVHPQSPRHLSSWHLILFCGKHAIKSFERSNSIKSRDTPKSREEYLTSPKGSPQFARNGPKLREIPSTHVQTLVRWVPRIQTRLVAWLTILVLCYCYNLGWLSLLLLRVKLGERSWKLLGVAQSELLCV